MATNRTYLTQLAKVIRDHKGANGGMQVPSYVLLRIYRPRPLSSIALCTHTGPWGGPCRYISTFCLPTLIYFTWLAEKLTAKDLKAELERYGLDRSGVKAALQERLLAHLHQLEEEQG